MALRRSLCVSSALVLFAGATQGCYTFRPVASTAALQPAQRVRIELTPQGTTELARFLGPNVTVAEGDLSSIRDDGTMVVAVDFVQQSNGIKQPWSGEGVVNFPAGMRAAVHERAFQRRQSIVAGTALGVGLVTTAIIALKVGGAGGGDGGPGTPPPP